MKMSGIPVNNTFLRGWEVNNLNLKATNNLRFGGEEEEELKYNGSNKVIKKLYTSPKI